MALLGWVKKALLPKQYFYIQNAQLLGESQISVFMLPESGCVLGWPFLSCNHEGHSSHEQLLDVLVFLWSKTGKQLYLPKH